MSPNIIYSLFLDALLPTTSSFAVYGSRMDYNSRPIWCLTQQPVDLTITDVETLSTNTDPIKFAVVMNFKAPTLMSVWNNGFSNFACESV